MTWKKKFLGRVCFIELERGGARTLVTFFIYEHFERVENKGKRVCAIHSYLLRRAYPLFLERFTLVYVDTIVGLNKRSLYKHSKRKKIRSRPQIFFSFSHIIDRNRI